MKICVLLFNGVRVKTMQKYERWRLCYLLKVKAKTHRSQTKRNEAHAKVRVRAIYSGSGLVQYLVHPRVICVRTL